MTNNKRITLRPAQAAAYLGCSPATIWRWAKTLENFPQPYKLPGQRVTVWFKDELDAWDAAQQGNRREVEDLALHLHEVVLSDLQINEDQTHPFLVAFFLAGGQSLTRLAGETDIPLRRLQALAENHGTLDGDELTRLFTAAATQVLSRQQELAQKVIDRPELQQDAAISRLLLDLDKAHHLCFGQTLMEFLRKQELAGGDHGNA